MKDFEETENQVTEENINAEAESVTTDSARAEERVVEDTSTETVEIETQETIEAEKIVPDQQEAENEALEAEPRAVILRDGTDITEVSAKHQILLRNTLATSSEILMWYGAKKLTSNLQYEDEFGEPFDITSNGFVFPDIERVYGYIVGARNNIKNNNERLFLDIAINNDDIRTIMAYPSLIGDPVAKAIRSSYGIRYRMTDFKYRFVRLEILNSKNNDGVPTYTKVVQFAFMNQEREEALKEAYKVISKNRF